MANSEEFCWVGFAFEPIELRIEPQGEPEGFRKVKLLKKPRRASAVGLLARFGKKMGVAQ